MGPQQRKQPQPKRQRKQRLQRKPPQLNLLNVRKSACLKQRKEIAQVSVRSTKEIYPAATPYSSPPPPCHLLAVHKNARRPPSATSVCPNVKHTKEIRLVVMKDISHQAAQKNARMQRPKVSVLGSVNHLKEIQNVAMK